MSSYETYGNVKKFFPKYPIQQNTFQSDIFHLKEYNDLRLTEDMPSVKDGDYLPQQKFIQRLFSPFTQNKRMLIWHEMGTGKSCIPPAIVENFKSIYGTSRALVLVPSENLSSEYKKTLSEVCTNGQYVGSLSSEEVARGRELTPELKKKRTNRLIGKYYSIASFSTFLKKFLVSRNYIAEKWSNSLIMVDEAHFLRIQPGKADTLKLYRQMWEFLHSVKNARILLLTGTPIQDKPTEIASMMNLLLPQDKQLPYGSSFDNEYFKGGEISNVLALKDSIKGMISYVRNVESNVEKRPMGTNEHTKWVKTVPSIMSDHQYEGFSRAAREVIKTAQKGVDMEIVGGAVYSFSRQASNCVFPDGSWGVEGFKRNTFSRAGQIFFKDDVKQAFSNLGSLEKYSCKFARIIREILEHKKEACFVFDEMVSGGGVILFSMILKLYGFVQMKKLAKIENMEEKNRFILLTSESPGTRDPKTIQDLLSVFNSRENKYGDFVRVIIGSGIVKTGFNFKHIRQIHIISPLWNIASLSQAEARGLRYKSHEALPEKERYIKTFRHCAISKTTGSIARPEDSIDKYIFSVAEKKDWKIQKILRILKVCASDCPLNWRRNLIQTDVDGSRECNYETCSYECDFWDDSFSHDEYKNITKSANIQSHNKEILYSFDEIREYEDELQDLFSKAEFLTYQELLEKTDRPEFIVSMGLYNCVTKSRPFTDKIGNKVYLKRSGNLFYTSKNPTSSSADDFFYSAKNFLQAPVMFETSLATDKMAQDKKKIPSFVKTPTIEMFNTFHLNTRIYLLEQVISLEKQNKPLPEVARVIKAATRRLVFETSEGIVHLLYTEEEAETAYSVVLKNIRYTGLMRIYRNNQWGYVGNERMERKLVEEIKKKRQDVEYRYPPGIDWAGALFLEDGEFRLKSRGGTGQVCSTLTRDSLFRIVMDIGLIKDVSKLHPSSSRKALLEILEQKTPREFVNQYKDTTIENLRKAATLATLNKTGLCSLIQKWFSESGFLNEV